MAKKRSDDVDPLDRIFAAFDEAPPGLHDVDPAASELPPGLPPALIDLYARCDGARLFVDALEIGASRDVQFELGRWKFAMLDGDAIAIDHRGRIQRADESIED